MLLFRSLTLGLLGAVLVLVASPREPASRCERTSRPADVRGEDLRRRAIALAHDVLEVEHALRGARESVTVIDVAAGVDPRSVPQLVRLGHRERIVAVDDRPVVNDLAAGAEIMAAAASAGRYIDLTVASPGLRDRRVLVLLH